MKNKVLKILKKQQLIISLSIVFSVILIIVLAPALYLRFTSWRSVADVNTQDLKKLQNVTENLALLQSVDSSTVDTYKNLIDKLVPEEPDQLRVVTLIDNLAKSSGVFIRSVKIGGGSTATSVPGAATPGAAPEDQSTSAPQTTGAQSPESTTAQSDAETTQAGATEAGSAQAAPTPTGPSSINLNITFDATFAGTLKLLRSLENAKRAIGIKNIALSIGEEEDSFLNILTVTADFTLPLSQKAQVSSQDKVELTQKDSVNLNDLVTRLTIDAVPTTLPTGRADPFN